MKGKRVDDAPADGSKSKEPHQRNKRGKKGKKSRREAREQERDRTQLDGALNRPLEALGYSTTC
jgi:hypothetical protein